MPLLGKERDRKGVEVMATMTRWLVLLAGVLTIVLGFIIVCSRSASLSVDLSFADDANNRASWRMALFSFTPSVFVDVWTPMFMGVITTLVHFPSFQCPLIDQNFWRMFLWLFIMAMFGNLGYEGGIGIIFGAITLFVDLLCLITAVIHDGPASLELAWPAKFNLAANRESKMTEETQV
eukprot:GHVS01075354.1.p1 GENE.GHVS01075354.1~~GHVS01075354.1.p1  ORF type:complete len:179 (+),score=21.47 GHVS01075354.1:229-765(+)